MVTIIEIQQEVEFFGMDWYDPACYAIKILDAKYEMVQIDDVVNQLEHLNIQQKADIKQVLSKFTMIFDGTLGIYPHRKFHIELEPNAKPKHARPYPVPVIHLEAFKKELVHLCKKRVLATQGNGLLLPLSHPKKMQSSLGQGLKIIKQSGCEETIPSTNNSRHLEKTSWILILY